MSPEARPELQADAILERLVARGVDFVVIGGIAAVLHGSPRATFDLDICFATDPGNLESLAAVLGDLRARLKGVADDVPFVADDVPFVADAETLRRVEVLTLQTSAGDLDLLSRPAGAPRYATLRRNADRYNIGGITVLVASLDDLVAMKRSVGRAKDRADIEELETIRSLRRRGAGG